MKKNSFPSKRILENIHEQVDSDKDPFYIYDKEKIKLNCKKFLDLPYTPKSIHFAAMANANPRFIQLVKDTGLNIFVNSIMHLEIAVKLGFTGEEIVYAASAMDENSMKIVQSSGAIIILDSIGQLEQWFRLFPDSDVGIRCNIGGLVEPKKTIAGYFLGKKSHLGLLPEEIKKLQGNANIKGLHLYVGTNLTEIKYFIDCYSHIADLAGLFPALRFLDFGGGYGLCSEINEKFDTYLFGQEVSNLMDQVSERIGRPVTLILEPGRIIGGDAGFFVCKVVDVKIRGELQFLGVNASSVQFPRPLFYPDTAYHPVSIIHRTDPVDPEYETITSVYGCSTYSRDYLARNVLLPQTSIGDIIIFGYAGSYCASAYTDFLGIGKTKEFLL